MSDRRYNLSERDRLLMATACRSLARNYRTDATQLRRTSRSNELRRMELAESAAQLEHLADTMATSA